MCCRHRCAAGARRPTRERRVAGRSCAKAGSTWRLGRLAARPLPPARVLETGRERMGGHGAAKHSALRAQSSDGALRRASPMTRDPAAAQRVGAWPPVSETGRPCAVEPSGRRCRGEERGRLASPGHRWQNGAHNPTQYRAPSEQLPSRLAAAPRRHCCGTGRRREKLCVGAGSKGRCLHQRG